MQSILRSRYERNFQRGCSSSATGGAWCAEALIRQMDPREVGKQKLGGYSGGMLQRFGVAAALLGIAVLRGRP